MMVIVVAALVLSALTINPVEIPAANCDVVVRAAGALFVASNGPSRGTIFAIEGIYVEKSKFFDSFSQVVVYEWRDADNDGAASEMEFIPVQVFVDNSQAAFLLRLVFPGIVQVVPSGSIQVGVVEAERTIRLRYGGSLVDLQVRSLEGGASPLRVQFVNSVTGWSFKAQGAEHPATATGYAYLPGLLLGESPVEPGSIEGFSGSGFLVPQAVIRFDNAGA
ncbi:MAG: hypothetical protein QW057_00045 [Candidatus Bathyarchaeia archaeon]